MTVLITGAAGFIGFHVADSLLQQGMHVIGYDNLNSYYDPALKQARLEKLKQYKQFAFYKAELTDLQALNTVANRHPDIYAVVHLAAQAGVRHSITAPFDYSDSNLAGHLAILEWCRGLPKMKHLVFASSSSVYGNSSTAPYSVTERADAPVSLYAATKRAGELMAYSYAHLYKIPTTALRFFTVYGPYGRPDMAYYSFTKAILEGAPITLFEQGKLRRDFTYIDDIVAGVIAALKKQPQGDVPYKVYNLGNNRPIEVSYFVQLIEQAVGKSATIDYAPMQMGDVYETSADITESKADLGFEPHVPIELGIPRFVEWYKKFYGN